MLAFGDSRGRVVMVDEATGEVKWAVQAHAREGPNDVNSRPSTTRVAMSPNGRFVASAGIADENWKLWEASSGAEWMTGVRHDGTGTCTCQVDDLGRRVLQTGCPVAAHTAGLRALEFSPCGGRFATADDKGAVILWDTQTGEAEQRMEAGSERVFSLSFTADGARLAGRGVITSQATICVWDTTTGVLLRTIRSKLCVSVQFSPTNPLTLASVWGQRITLWDVDSGEEIESFPGCGFMHFSPDGRTIATGDSSGVVVLMDVQSGERRLTLVGHQGCVSEASWSVEDGSKLATVSCLSTCKVWDSSTGALLRTIQVGTPMDPRPVSVSWGRDWVRDTQRGVAFAMGHHPRLGEKSRVLALDVGVVRMILDRV